jgi:hypothetical protein
VFRITISGAGRRVCAQADRGCAAKYHHGAVALVVKKDGDCKRFHSIKRDVSWQPFA